MSHDLFNFLREEHRGHYVTPEQLRVGLYVYLDLGWMSHPFALGNFKIKDEAQIGKIRALNLKRIRYDPLRSDVVPEFPKTIQLAPEAVAPALPPETPQNPIRQSNRLKQLNEAILESEQVFAAATGSAREAVRTLGDHPEHSRKLAEQLVGEMSDSMLAESDVALNVVTGAQGQYVHSLNVVVLALMLARSVEMGADEMKELGLAALFHDAGKEDDAPNKSFVDLHCETGAGMALRAGLSERVSRMILQHHEAMDGSGYPLRLKGERIDPLARLLALVNYFDNLCNPANPSDALTPYEALAQMYASQSQKFDAAMLQRLVKLLGVYPPGSVVQLSNGMYGLVLAANSDKPLQPVVMVYVPEVARETPVVIDLGEQQDVTIRKCLRPRQLPEDVFYYLKPAKRMSFYFFNKGAIDAVARDEASAEERQRA